MLFVTEGGRVIASARCPDCQPAIAGASSASPATAEPVRAANEPGTDRPREAAANGSFSIGPIAPNEPGPSVFRQAAAGAMAVLIAAGFACEWFWVSRNTDLPTRYLPALVGALVGVLCWLVGARGERFGGVCGVLAVLAVVAGMGGVKQATLDEDMQRERDQVYTQGMYDELAANAELFAMLPENASKYDQLTFLIERGYSKAKNPAAVGGAEFQSFLDETKPVLVSFQALQPGFQSWQDTHIAGIDPRDGSLMGLVELVRADFTIADYLSLFACFLLAYLAVFKLRIRRKPRSRPKAARETDAETTGDAVEARPALVTSGSISGDV